MKIRFARLTAGAVVLLALALPVNSPANPGRHPEIRQAINALERAKEHLQAAAHDFGGHRAAALRAVDEAIQQLQICLNY